jgi:hypothetical protein
VLIKADTVIKWVDDNLPPLSWRIIAIDIMKVLLANKVMPAKIDSTTYFNPAIMDDIRKTVKDKYNKDMPNF